MKHVVVSECFNDIEKSDIYEDEAICPQKIVNIRSVNEFIECKKHDIRRSCDESVHTIIFEIQHFYFEKTNSLKVVVNGYSFSHEIDIMTSMDLEKCLVGEVSV